MVDIGVLTDCSESQYRTKLKRWKRRKPRQNHQPRAHTAPPNARVTVSQPSTQGSDEVQSHSQNYTGPSQQVFGDRGHAAHSVEQRSIQVPPFAAAELIPPEPSSQVENSWHVELGELYNGFLPSSVEHRSTAYGPLSNLVHHQSMPEINVPEIDIPEIDTHYDQTYGEDLLDFDQVRSVVRNRTAENMHGGQGQSRVVRGTRWRCQPLPQQAKGDNPSSIIPLPGPRLPSCLEETGQSHLPGVYCQNKHHLPRSNSAWWSGEETDTFDPNLGNSLPSGLGDQPLS